MSNSFELSAKSRTVMGKGASRRLRREGKELPAILYGGEHEPVMLTVQANQVRKALENEAFYSHILTLDVDGKKEKVVLRDLQRHPVRSQVVHMDFLRVSAKEALVMHVPLHFLNEESAPGVKAGGIVTHQVTDIEIKCLPADLPEFISVDLAKLEIDHAIHLSEIKLPKGVTFARTIDADHDVPVASIHKPHMAPVEDTAPVAQPVPSENGGPDAAEPERGA